MISEVMFYLHFIIIYAGCRITLNVYKMYFATVNNYLLKKLSNDNWLDTVTFELHQ